MKEAEEADEAARKAGSDDLNRQEAQLKKKAARGAWSIAKDKASLQLSQERIQSYEDAFAKIQAATGIDDIDELVDKFIEAGRRTFGLQLCEHPEPGHREAGRSDIRGKGRDRKVPWTRCGHGLSAQENQLY